ncbi:MAG: hypothetical protein PHO37_17585 [Kiritimatiellae bacterium]|nr:hypothetical protein [Kiritimatiellia bacterium]
MNRFTQALSACVLALLLIMAGGCTTPIGVASLGRDYAYEQIDQSALSSDTLSSYSTAVLHRYNLDHFKGRSRNTALKELHQLAINDDRRDTLFALAELSFLMGKEGYRVKERDRTLESENFFAASAAYAYLYLLAPGEQAPPDAFDRRFRLACDLYNRSLSYILARHEGRGRTGEHDWQLPVGHLVIRQGGASDFEQQLKLQEDETYVSADRLRIHGLSVRNRNAGLGAPIVIVGDKRSNTEFIPEGSAATVFIRLEGDLQDMTEGGLRGQVEIYSSFMRDHIEVAGRKIPLEADLTTHIAYALSNPIY